MPGRYLPPHQRNQTASEPQADAAASDARQEAVTSDSNHDPSDDGSTRRSLASLSLSTPQSQRPLHTLQEICSHYQSQWLNGTLHDSEEFTNQLAYVVLHHNANPRWKDDGIIFAHTNIKLLPGYDAFVADLDQDKEHTTPAIEGQADEIGAGDTEPGASEANVADPGQSLNTEAVQEGVWEIALEAGSDVSRTEMTPSDQRASMAADKTGGNATLASTSITDTIDRPIPVFSEFRFKYSDRKLVFSGYYKLTAVDYLKPNSPELIKMLEQKWQLSQQAASKPASRGSARGWGRGGQNGRGGRGGRARPAWYDRDAEAWKRSLNETWAVLELATWEEAGQAEQLEAPVINVIEEVAEAEGDKGGANGLRAAEAAPAVV